MNKRKAREVLARELDGYRAMSYAELVELIGHIAAYEVALAGGCRYQIEIQVFWDSQPDRDVRVIGSVDDGGLSAFFPLTDSFIMSPGGELVGE